MRKVSKCFGLLFLLVWPVTHGQEPRVSPDSLASQSPEIRLTKSPFWKSGYLCLDVSLRNQSRSTVYFPPTPYDGIVIKTSVMDVTNTLRQGPGRAWLIVYGWADVTYQSQKSFRSGASEYHTYCLNEHFEVMNSEMACAKFCWGQTFASMPPSNKKAPS